MLLAELASFASADWQAAIAGKAELGPKTALA